MTVSADQPVIVVGGGLAGVTTLYELAADGIPAILLESKQELAAGASHANGGLLTPGLGEPWNSPGVHKHLFESLFDPASPMKLRIRAIPGLTPWGIRFLMNSGRSRFEKSTIANFALAAYSLQRTMQLAEELGLEFDVRQGGCLKVFHDEEEMAESLHLCRLLQPHGLRFDVLDTDGVVSLEPSLAGAADKIGCGIHYPDEASGDARKFTVALAEAAVALGADVRTAVTVERLTRGDGRITGVVANGESLSGAVVLTAGIDSPALSRTAGLSFPIKPAKGYSLTVDATTIGDDGPRMPVVDQHMHAAVSPLGTRLRFVGTAEFTGRDERIRQDRIDNLFSLFRRLFPQLVDRVDRSSATPWAGLRPMSADGRPFIGASGIDGLWINSGHGHMGWSQAPGSARLLVDLLQGRHPGIDSAPFDPQRRHGEGRS